MSTRVAVHGRFRLAFRDKRGATVWEAYFRNGVTVAGANHFAEAAFRGGSRFSQWYVGLIDQAGFAQLDPADTAASHPGWNEFVLVPNRGLWVPGPAGGGLLSAASQTSVPITGAGTVRGAFLASRQATGLAAGAVLYATGAAGSGLPVSAGGTVTINYSVRYTPR